MSQGTGAAGVQQARAAAQQARAAAEQARATAAEARSTADEARAAAREAAQNAGADGPGEAVQVVDPPGTFKGITFGDGQPPVTADFENGNLILHQGTHTATVPWRDAIPAGAVQIAWAIPATLSILLIWCPLTRAVTGWLRRKTAVAQDTAALEARLRERFETIERNVDTVAIEMERLAEGQRFTNKLLSERQAGVAVPGAPAPVQVPVNVPAGTPRA
jgi:hypothetical protein